MSSLRQVIVATSLLSGVVFLSGKPRIHYVEPLALLVGGTTEVTIHGIVLEMATKRLASGQTSIVSGSFFRMRKVMPERFDFK